MAKSNNIKDELLKQMDKDLSGSTEVSEESARKTIEDYQAQARRIKILTILSWAITVSYFFAMFSLKDFLMEGDFQRFLTENEFLLMSYMNMGTKVLVVISVLVTYLSYTKSKTLTMLQICARLAGIEEQLKRMSQDK